MEGIRPSAVLARSLLVSMRPAVGAGGWSIDAGDISGRRRPAVGRSHDEFVKYPRTPHLFGSKGTDDDKHLGAAESARLLAEGSLIVEEKLDGTNVGIHFTAAGEMALQ